MAQQKGGSGRRGRPGGGREESGEALRALVGAGPSKVGISAALRARDTSRPGDEDIAAAVAMPPPRVGPPVTTQSHQREPVEPAPASAAPADQSGGNGGSEPSSS